MTLATASTSAESAGLADQLVQKEIDYNELQSLFTKYKLKQKVKYDKLRDEVLAYIKKTGTSTDKENNAMLMIRVTETEAKLEEAERRNDALNRELQRRQTQINDQTILLKNLEDQLRAKRPLSDVERSERRRMNDLVDMESVHAQMMYKDERIIELNNVILDKERQILDLQELVREHDEVASSKKQAMRLVQKRFEELDSKTHRTIGTETDFTHLNGSPSHTRSRNDGVSFSRPVRGTSPGRAVKGNQSSHGTSSPPPLDPSEDTFDDEDQPGSSNLVKRLLEEKRKKKLRVTFDLPASGSVESIVGQPPENEKNGEKIDFGERQEALRVQEEIKRESEEMTAAVHDLSAENERLRGVIDEQNARLTELQLRLSEVDQETMKIQKDNKSAVAKARVVAQARIKDLEDKMAELNSTLSSQIESLQTENETLRSTREWEIEENAKMRERLAKTLEKNHKLHGEVEANLVVNCELETRMLAEHEVMQRMMEDLEDAERIIVQQDDEKAQMAEDMELMRGAIIAQEQFIEVLEADIVIYEEHIGILRDSLGASKVDHRDLIRSKAFEAKLRALEEEKQEIARTRHDERLKTKALNAKVRLLEGENEKLMARICEMEMRGNGEHHGHEELPSGHPSNTQITQLEHQLHESEIRLLSMREEFDHQLANARSDSETATRSAQFLRDTVDRLEEELRMARDRPFNNYPEGKQDGQTVIPPHDIVTQQEIEDLRSRTTELQSALETTRQIREELTDQINHIGAENFELRGRISTLQRDAQEANQLRATVEALQQSLNELEHVQTNNETERRAHLEEINRLRQELERSVDRYNELCTQLAIAHQQATTWQYRAEQADTQLAFTQPQGGSSVELIEPLQSSSEQDTSEIDGLRKEVSLLKEELDHARFSLAETREVQKEVELLRAELEEERRQTEEKWEEVCEKLIKSTAERPPDTPTGRSSRKASLDEMHSYLDAYAEKCKRLEEELRETKEKVEHTPSSSEISRNVTPELEAELAVCQQRIADMEHNLERKTDKITQLAEELRAAQEKIDADKLEKKKLKAAVKQLRDRQGPQQVQISPNPPNEPRIEVTQMQQTSSQQSAFSELPVEQNFRELEEKLSRAEMESFESSRLVEEMRAELNKTRSTAHTTQVELEERIEELRRETEGWSVHEAREREEHIRYEQMIRDLEAKLSALQQQLYGQTQSESVTEVENREYRITTEIQIQDLQNRLFKVEEAKNEAELEAKKLKNELETAKSQASAQEQAFNDQISFLEEQQVELSFRAENAEESFNQSDLHEKVIKALQKEVDSLKAKLSMALCEVEAKEEENQRLHREIQEGDKENAHEFTRSRGDFEDLQQEIQRLHSILEDRENQVAALENQLSLNEETAICEEVIIESSQLPQDIQHESLLRATAATSTAVNNLLATAPRSPSTGSQFGQQQPSFIASDWPQQTPQWPQPSTQFTPRSQPQMGFPSVHQVMDHGYATDHHHHHHHGHQDQGERHQSSGSQVQLEETPILAMTPTPGQPRDGGESSYLEVSPSIQQQLPVPLLSTNTERDLFAENQLLRECVNETTRMHDTLGDDVKHLLELRAELETAIEALQAEIWSLNGQLKASVLDRENLSDRLADLDSQVTIEKRRADQLDQELSEQVELTEKAQRQAAESENESNRRLAECLEMENRREELEKAYAQLMEYYTQLHASYEALYASVNSKKNDESTETEVGGTEISKGQEALRLYGVYKDQFKNIHQQALSLREALKIFAQDLTKSDLISLESSINVELSRIQSAAGKVSDIQKRLNNGESSDLNELNQLVDSLIGECGLEIPTDADLIAKVDEMAAILQSKTREAEETKKAVLQQQRICQALEERLQRAEQSTSTPLDVQAQLEDTQLQLRQRNHEVAELQARVDELKAAVTELAASREEEQEATSTGQRLRTEVAILAARLATRQADCDSLFRANAELAHTNVRLQNEIDELEEQREQRQQEQGGSVQQEEMERLRAVEVALNHQLVLLDRQLVEDRRRIAELERQLAEAHQQTANIEQSTHQQASPPDEELLEELTRLQSVEKLLNKTISGYEEKLMEAEERIHELEIEIDEGKNQQQSGQSDQDWGWGEQDEPQESIQVSRLGSSAQNQESETQLRETQEKMREEERKRAEIQDELEELRTEYETLLETLSSLKEYQEKEKNKSKELEADLEKVNEEKKILEEKLEEQQVTKEETTRDWGDSWGDEAQANSIEKAEREALEAQKEALKEKVQSLLEQIDRLEEEFLEKLDEKESIEAELREKIKELEREKADLEEKALGKEEASAWSEDWGSPSGTREDINELKERLAETENEATILRAEVDSRNQTIQELLLETENLQSQLETLEAEKRNLVDKSTVEASKIDWGSRIGLLDESDSERSEDIKKDLKEALEDRKRLANQVEQLEEQVDELMKKLDETEQNQEILEELRTEVEILREKLEGANGEVTQLRDQLERSEPEPSQWGWGDEEETREDDKVDDRVSELESQLQELSLRTDVLTRQLEERELKISELNGQQEVDQEEKNRLIQHIQGIEQELSSKEEALSLAKDSQQDLEGLENEIENLRDQLTRVTYENEEIKERSTQERAELTKRNDEILEELRTEVEILREKLETANGEITQLRDQLERSEPEPSQWGWGDEGGNQQDSKADDRVSELESQLQELSLRLDVLTRQLEEKELKISELNDKQAVDQEEKDRLIQHIQGLERELSSKEEALSLAKDSQQDLEGLENEIENLRDQLTRVTYENEEIKERITEVPLEKKEDDKWGWGDEDEGQKEGLEAKIEEMKAQIETSSQEISTLKARIEELEAEARDSNELQESLQAEVTELLHRLQETEKALENEKRIKEELKDQADRLSSEANELRNEIQGNQGSNDQELEDLRKQLEAARTKCNLLMDSESRLLEQVDEYGAQADAQREESQRLQQVINQLEAKLGEEEELREKISELEEKLESSQSTSRPSDPTESEEYQKLTKTLELKEAKIESLILAKQGFEGRFEEAQRRLRAVEQERDTAKRLYDELRAKLVAAKRKANSTMAPQSRRSSGASTSAHLDLEIPEEPTSTQRPSSQLGSPRFDSPLDSPNNQTNGHELEESLGELSERFDLFLRQIGEVFEIHEEHIEEFRSAFKRKLVKMVETRDGETQSDQIDENLTVELKAELERVQKDLAQSQAETSILMAKIEEMEEIERLSMEKLVEFERNRENREAEIEEILKNSEETLNSRTLELQHLKKLFANSAEIQLSLEQERDELRAQLGLLKEKFEEVEHQKETFRLDLEESNQRDLVNKELLNEKQRVEEEKSQLETELTALKEKHKQAEDQIGELEEQKKELKLNLEEATHKGLENDELLLDRERVVKAKIDQDAELMMLKENYQQAKERIEELEKEREELELNQAELVQKDLESNELLKEKDALEAELLTLKEKYEQALENIEELRNLNEKTHLESELIALKENYEEALEKIKELRELNEKQKPVLDEKTHLESEMMTLKDKYEQTRARLGDLEAQNERFELDLQAKTQLKLEFDQLKERYEEAIRRIEEFEKSEVDRAQIEHQRGLHEEEILAIRKNHQELMEEKEKKNQETLQEREIEVENLKKRVRVLERDLQESNQEISSLQDKNIKLEAEKSKINDLQDQLEAERQASKILKDQLEANRLETISLQETLASTTNNSTRLEEILDDLKSQSFLEIQQRELQIQEIQAQLGESEAKCSLLQAEISQIREKSEMLRNSSERNDTEIHELWRANEALREELEAKNEKLSEFEARFYQEKEENDRRTEDLIRENEERRKIIASTEKELASTAERLEEKEAVLGSNKEEIQKLIDINNQIKKQLNEMASEKILLQRELSEEETKFQEASKQINELTSEKDSLQKELEQKALQSQGYLQLVPSNEARVDEREPEIQVELSLPLGGAANEELQYLRGDCVRLETQLREAHDSIQDLQKEVYGWQQRVDSRDRCVAELKNEIQALKSQLQQALFENEQLRRSASNQDPTERILEMEREVNEIKTRLQNRIDALMEDLRAAEQELELRRQREQEIVKSAGESAEAAEEWKLKWETAMQEIEAIQRCADEASRLGNALERSRVDQRELIRRLEEAEEMGKRAQQEKDALHAQLTIVSQQLEDRTERLRRAGEAKMNSMLRLVEMESRLNASRQAVAEQRRAQLSAQNSSNNLLQGSSVTLEDEDSLLPSREELLQRLTYAEAKIREVRVFLSSYKGTSEKSSPELESLDLLRLDEPGNLEDEEQMNEEEEDPSTPFDLSMDNGKLEDGLINGNTNETIKSKTLPLSLRSLRRSLSRKRRSLRTLSRPLLLILYLLIVHFLLLYLWYFDGC